MNSKEVMSANPSCRLDANPVQGMERRHFVRQLVLVTEAKEVLETAEGWKLTFTDEAERVRSVAEFVATERICCPFLGFTLDVQPNADVIVTIHARENAREFVRAELLPSVEGKYVR